MSEGDAQARSTRDDAARQRFSWLVAHALNGVTHSILGALSLLRDAPEGEQLTPRQRRLVDAASVGAEQLAQLNADILFLTHAEGRTIELNKERVLLTTLLRTAIAQAQTPLAPSAPRDIQSRISPALPPLLCDVTLMRRALAAIIENALRFSPANAPVRIEARKRRDRIVIRVVGGGAGIAPADAERIFEPLSVGARPRASVGVGLGVGLGLAVARVCAEAHGGSLRLVPAAKSSDAPGATFAMELPLTSAPDSASD